MTPILLTAAVEEADEVCVPRLLDVLAEDERARAARFVFPRDRRSYAAAHGLLRAALVAVAGPRSWRFRTGAWGKPELEDGLEELHFNLSHTDGRVAVALARGVEIGVDVEGPIRVGEEGEGFLRRILAPEEVRALLAAEDPADRLQALWTLKEATMKATGRGLSLPPDRVVFRGEPPLLAALPAEHGPVAEWTAWSRRMGRHRLALAGRGLPGDVVVREVAVTEILDGLDLEG